MKLQKFFIISVFVFSFLFSINFTTLADQVPPHFLLTASPTSVGYGNTSQITIKIYDDGSCSNANPSACIHVSPACTNNYPYDCKTCVVQSRPDLDAFTWPRDIPLEMTYDTLPITNNNHQETVICWNDYTMKGISSTNSITIPFLDPEVHSYFSQNNLTEINLPYQGSSDIDIAWQASNMDNTYSCNVYKGQTAGSQVYFKGPFPVIGLPSYFTTDSPTNPVNYYSVKCQKNGGNEYLSNNIDALVVTNPTNFPDLIASVPTPTNAVATVAKTFSSIIANNGNASTGTSTFTNLFQTATGFDDSQNPIGITNYEVHGMNPLDPSAIATVTSPAITFPDVGTYYMRVCADNDANMSGTITESIETNNCSNPWTPIIVNPVTPKPDLTIVGDVSPTTATVGVEQTFSSTVKNQGNASTGNSGSKFYNFFQVTDTNPSNFTPGGGGAYLQKKYGDFFSMLFVPKANASLGLIDLPKSSMTAIGINQTKIATVKYTFASVGTYWMRACADKSDRNTLPPADVVESNEGNNCGDWTSIAVNNISQKPDLTAGNVTPTTATVGGKGTTFYSTIANIGNASTGTGFTNLIKVSPNSNGVPFQSTTKAMAVLGAGSFNTMSFTKSFTTTGTYYVQVCADQNASNVGTIDEIDETNNCSDWTQITITDSTNPIGALTVTDCYITSGNSGCDTNLDWNITNPIPNANTEITTPVNISVPGTNTTTGSTTYSISKGPSSVVFYLYHNGNQLATATANASCAKGTIWDKTEGICKGNTTPPDLVASSIAPENVYLASGETKDIHFTALITNQGGTSTIKSFVNLFQIAKNVDEKGNGEGVQDFSTARIDPYLDANSSQPITSMDSYTFNEPGTIYVRACADKSDMNDAGVIVESNEDNNCGVWTQVSASVGLPDLVAGITNPPAVPVGEKFYFSASIKNQGNVSTVDSFPNIFQMADGIDESGNMININDIGNYVNSDALDAGASTTIQSDPYVFDQPTEKYIRVCADKSNMNDPFGNIAESNEDNNCGAWTKITAFDDARDGKCSPTHYGCIVGNSINGKGSGTPDDPWTWVCEGFNNGANVDCSEVSNKYCMDPNASNYKEYGSCEYKKCVPINGKSCGVENCPPCGNGNGNGTGNGKKPGYVER